MFKPIAAIGCAVVLTASLHAQGLGQYRHFTFGSSVAAVSGLTGVAASSARVVHQRPALLQDLEWRLSPWGSDVAAATPDPVERMAFSFYNDQLYRIVVDYGTERTEGMTAADLIDAISLVYGAPLKGGTAAARPPARVDTETGVLVARWSEAGYLAGLYRLSSYREPFRLIVTASSLDDRARQAASQAILLDEREAPQREIARAKKQQDDKRDAAEKARTVNKGGFRP